MTHRDQALKRKMALLRDLRQRMPDRSPFEPDGIQRAFAVDIESFPMGRLENVDSIHLNWVNERFFEYVPDGAHPLRFSRSTGEQITPGRMFTDGGSIPREFWWKQGLSPWEYGPAYLIHDWEFDLHHCHESARTFEEVRDTMMEALRTLMTMPVVTYRPFVFELIYDGINSRYAKSAWNQDPGCTLPRPVTTADS